MRLTYKLSSLVGPFLLGICIFVLGWFAQSKSFQTFHIRDIDYFGAPELAQGKHNVGPVAIKELRQRADLKALDVSFEFSTQEPTFSYGNLFQTGDSLDAIRMELQPPSNLILVLGDGRLFPLSNSIKVGEFHGVRLKYEREKSLQVAIDGAEVLSVTDKSTLAGAFDISNIVVGAGLAQQRTLLGVVRNFNLDCVYGNYDKISQLARWLLILISAVVFLKSLPSTAIHDDAHKGDATPYSDVVDVAAIYGFSIACVAVALLSIHFFGERHFGLSKWLAHLMLPISVAAVFAIRQRTWNRVRWMLGLVFLAYGGVILVATRHKVQPYDDYILGMTVVSLLAFGLSSARAGVVPSWPQGGTQKYNSVIGVGVAWLFLALSWSSLVDLTNWSAFRQALGSHFGLVVVGVFVIMRALLAVVLWQEKSIEISNRDSSAQGKSGNRTYSRYLDFLVIGIFLWISFRYDSLFLPGSEYHWEYFVGVIQGINNGGWLLWDVPSQYGFLNILLASLVPSASPWQSFYLFQGTLLFVVATSLYFAARRYTTTSIANQLVAFAVVFMAVFFADPALIGPYPFPSSSVVRFFCVYALVLVAWRIPKYGLRQAVALSAVWLLAVIWSAESAVYGTAIFLFILFALLQSGFGQRGGFALVAIYAAIAFTYLGAFLVMLVGIYWARLGVMPDLRAYFEYAFGYAGGFGYVPFPLKGPGNLLLLVFLGISLLWFGAIRRQESANLIPVAPLAAMVGCIWGTSTYYVGRPVPQNVTAMLPIIAMSVYFSLVLARQANVGWHSLPIKAVALPLLFLVLIPLFSPKWAENLRHIQSFSSDIASRLPKASSELQQLLARVDPSAETPIVYYGDDAAPPIFSGDYAKFNGRTWLPIPMQLLETPISEERRSAYIARYLCRHRPDKGILVERKGGVSARLPGFIRELRQFYGVVDAIPGATYNIYRFSGLNLQGCSLKVGEKAS